MFYCVGIMIVPLTRKRYDRGLEIFMVYQLDRPFDLDMPGSNIVEVTPGYITYITIFITVYFIFQTFLKSSR
jgi:hypothetical protein